ncbi:hypothetical protein [Lichenicola sp.]|uniref:hypothetical protein n=1 Tax=Lichenicola sp. TaxID=2804529 RepID=UPI003B003366
MSSSRAVAPLLVAVMLLVFGTNLQGVLLPILGHTRGAGMTAIGLYSAGWSAGFVLACLSNGWILAFFGPVWAFAMLALVSATAAMLLLLVPGDPSWIVLRVVIGFCYGGLSAIVEGWLVAQAGVGIGFASYVAVGLIASLCGTLSLNVINPHGAAPFVLMTGAVLGSILPVLLCRRTRPARMKPFRTDIIGLVRQSPVGGLGCVAAGLITGAVGGLGPILGMMGGLGMREDTLMLAANTVGGTLASIPVALLGRAFGRRLMLGGIALLGVAACVPLVLPLPGVSLVVLLGVFGCAQYPLYGLCVGIANAQAPERPAARISTELLLLFGLGTIVGPLIAAPLLARGIDWMFGFLGAIFGAIAVAATLTQSGTLIQVTGSADAKPQPHGADMQDDAPQLNAISLDHQSPQSEPRGLQGNMEGPGRQEPGRGHGLPP